jgi:hypothetical protein
MNFPTVAIPIGILLSPFKTRIEKFLLLDTYLTSHRDYLKRDGFLVRWEEIAENLEVSLSFPSVLDNDRVPMARIAVRGTALEPIGYIRLLTEAESTFCTYQETVELFNVGKKPKITPLPSIPLRTFYISDDLEFTESMDKFRIYILQLGSAQPPTTSPNSYALTTYPNTIDLMNNRFEERWGAYWNMAAIDVAIREQAHYLIYYLATPKVYYGSDSKVPLSAFAKGFLRAIVGRPLCWLLTRPLLLKAYFWVPILVFRRKWEIKNG